MIEKIYPGSIATDGCEADCFGQENWMSAGTKSALVSNVLPRKAANIFLLLKADHKRKKITFLTLKEKRVSTTIKL